MKYYSNPEGDQSKIIEVKLTDGDRATKALLKQLEARLYVIQAERQKLMDACKHDKFYDLEGFPYDVRYCAVCGMNMGLV